MTVTVDVAPEVMLVGLNETEAPLGAPLDERLTVCAEPLVVAVLTVDVPLVPGARASEVGLTEIEKSLGGGVGLIVQLTLVLCVTVPSVPVMVTV